MQVAASSDRLSATPPNPKFKKASRDEQITRSVLGSDGAELDESREHAATGGSAGGDSPDAKILQAVGQIIMGVQTLGTLMPGMVPPPAANWVDMLKTAVPQQLVQMRQSPPPVGPGQQPAGMMGALPGGLPPMAPPAAAPPMSPMGGMPGPPPGVAMQPPPMQPGGGMAMAGGNPLSQLPPEVLAMLMQQSQQQQQQGGMR